MFNSCHNHTCYSHPHVHIVMTWPTFVSHSKRTQCEPNKHVMHQKSKDISPLERLTPWMIHAFCLPSSRHATQSWDDQVNSISCPNNRQWDRLRRKLDGMSKWLSVPSRWTFERERKSQTWKYVHSFPWSRPNTSATCMLSCFLPVNICLSTSTPSFLATHLSKKWAMKMSPSSDRTTPVQRTPTDWGTFKAASWSKRGKKASWDRRHQ